MIILSSHAETVISERKIERDWLAFVIRAPQRIEEHENGTIHYIRQIPQIAGRWLRVVTSRRGGDIIVVTAFVDRRVAIREERP